MPSDRAKELAADMCAKHLVPPYCREQVGVMIQAALDEEREESLSDDYAAGLAAGVVERVELERKADWYRLLVVLLHSGKAQWHPAQRWIRIGRDQTDPNAYQEWTEFDEDGLPIENPALRAKLEAVRG